MMRNELQELAYQVRETGNRQLFDQVDTLLLTHRYGTIRRNISKIKQSDQEVVFVLSRRFQLFHLNQDEITGVEYNATSQHQGYDFDQIALDLTKLDTRPDQAIRVRLADQPDQFVCLDDYLSVDLPANGVKMT